MEEQGQLCAYTGIRISIKKSIKGDSRVVRFHIEHIKPQKYCEHGDDTEYKNLVVCWPPPNVGYEPQFGARKKNDWPDPNEEHDFLSPLDESCTGRFRFKKDGTIEPARRDDRVARTTIEKFGLNHIDLIGMRKEGIRKMLFPYGNYKRQLTKAEAKKLYDRLKMN